jgi:hypothetical protein
MLGRGNIGMVFTTLEAAKIFAFMRPADARRVTKEHDCPDTQRLLACKPVHLPSVMLDPKVTRLARMGYLPPSSVSDESEQMMLALQLSKEQGQMEDNARAKALEREGSDTTSHLTRTHRSVLESFIQYWGGANRLTSPHPLSVSADRHQRARMMM